MPTVIASYASEAMSQHSAFEEPPQLKLYKTWEPAGLVGALDKRSQMVL